jgi:amidohydrolase
MVTEMSSKNQSIIDNINSRISTYIEWRRDFHKYPEIAFKEYRTSDLVAERLAAAGIEVHRGFAGTGVVGILRRGAESRMIGLRADMDALPLDELGDLPYKSSNPGLMHGCGHDGHTAMLLGAAETLAHHGRFDGTVCFVFQPAEENEAGAGVMVREGFFDRFPIERMFGLHNRPQLPLDQFALRRGPFMSAADNFGVTLSGHGGHGGSPHLAVDPMVMAAEFIMAAQTIVARHTNPLDAAVISITQITAGKSDNVIADQVILRGTARSLTAEVQDRIEKMLRDMAHHIAAMHGGEAEVAYERRYPALANDAELADACAAVAADLVGEAHVTADIAPSMGSDDFSFFALERPSSFIWLGTGPVERGRYLHNPRYDFNDEAMPTGIAYWCRLVERMLPEKDNSAI